MLKNRGFRIGSGLRRRVVAVCLFLAPCLLLISLPSSAQNAQDSDAARLFQQMQQGTGTLGSGNLSAVSGQLSQQSQTYQPTGVAPSLAPLPASRLEEIMSARAGSRLRQFGYDQVGQGRAVTIPQTGAVQDDYILGQGDEIVVSMRGQENGEFRVAVDRSGRILLPRLNPIAAEGRSFGDVRSDIESAVRRSFVATTAFVSVGQVRQATVLVAGEVNVPGQRIIPGLSSVVDALVLSGGVKKTGSLRNIRIQRGDKTFAVDLYSVLTDLGGASNIRLADGDRILVPPLGKTVAVSGLVRRPGIYELPPSASSVPARSLLALAGGLEVRGQYRLSALRISANGSSQMVLLANDNGTIGDSEILFVQLGADQTLSQATLSGGTPLAGQYPITTGTRLSDVLKSPGALPPEPYTLFGIIARRDPQTMLRMLMPFTPAAVLSGKEDQPLHSGDIIRVLSVNEVRLLTDTVRAYTERQSTEQAAVENPLGELDTDDTLPGQVAKNGQSAGNLADMQRRDIAELAEQVDPVTRQSMAAATRAQQEQIAEQQRAFLQQNPQLQYQQQQTQQLQQMQQQQQQQQFQLQQQQFQVQLQQQQQQIQQQRTANGLTATPGGQATGMSSGTTETTTGSDLLIPAPALNFQSTDAMSGQIASNIDIHNFGDLARQLDVDQLVLVNFLIGNQVGLDGAVNGPGLYFVGPNVPLQDLVQAAGGTANWADESGVELISTVVDTAVGRSATRRIQLPLRQGMLANYVVRPRDQFRFNQVFTDASLGTATVQGEVHFSGSFQITRGEHLSDLLARAGGLTSTAYPYGTVFLRRSAAAIERAGYVRAANDVENGLVVGLTSAGTNRLDPTTFAALQSFVVELRNTKAVGRVSIIADPSVLATKPELDPLLEAGDVLYIPPRPSTITVLGQVKEPGTMPFRSGGTLKDYIEAAGGYNQGSDEDNTFIVLPDGTAHKIETSWLGFDANTNLPPGSTIVVPRDLTPFNIYALVGTVTSIFSQLAVSAASLAVLSTVK